MTSCKRKLASLIANASALLCHPARASAQVLGLRSKTGVFIPLAYSPNPAWRVERSTENFLLGDWTVRNDIIRTLSSTLSY